MLQSMRQLAHSWPIKGLMLFLAVSFSIWGIGDIFRGNPLKKSVASVGKTEISVEDLNRLFQESLAQARRTTPSLTAPQAKQLGLLDKSLDNEIKRDLIDQDVARQGIVVSQDYVLQMLAKEPQFRSKDGTFNKVMFQQLLQQQGLSEQSFLHEGQQDMSRQALVGIFNGGHSASDTEIDALYKARGQKRVLEVVTVDASKLDEAATPDDKALHDFYDAHLHQFMAPEYRNLTVATLSSDTIAKDITISDEELKKAYDSKLEELAQPEKRDVIQVVMQDEEKAKQLVKSARATGNLTDAAKKAKETAIPLDQLESKNLMAELSKPVFEMHPNDISDPIKTQLGWHVVQLEKITPAGTPSFASVKDKMRQDMIRDQAVETATRNVNQLDDELAAGHSLDDISKDMKLSLVKIPSVDATGLMPNGKAPDVLPNKEQVLKDGFAQSAGETSPVEDDKTGNYYIVHTDDVTPAGPKPFESIKKTVASAWVAEQQAAKAKAEADKIAESMRKGDKASSFASDEGVSIRTSTPLSKIGDTDALLPGDLIAQAFRLKKGEIATSMLDKKQFVVRLTDIIDVDAKQDDPRKNTIAGEVRKNTSNELLDQYIAHLYDVFDVKTHTAVLDDMRQQDN